MPPIDNMGAAMGLETELKLRIPASRARTEVPRWLGDYEVGRGSRHRLVSTYFDTPKCKLRRHGLSLRIRQDGERYTQTVKTAKPGKLGRGEWETEIAGDEPELDKADDTPLARFSSKGLRRKLKPLFKTSVDRTTVPISGSGSEIELAIDHGRVAAGHHSTPIGEYELELKHGRPAELFRLARTAAQRADAELDLRSKAQRGYALLQEKPDAVVFAEPIALDEDMNAAEAFRAIGMSCLAHFAGNANAVRKADPEGVHQMRVGLRRLRAALSLFGDMLEAAGRERIKSELKWLTDELGPAREIDVFVSETIEPARREITPQRGRQAVEEEFIDKHERALERAAAAATSVRFRVLLVDVMEWLQQSRGRGDDADVPIGKLAPKILRRRIRKLQKLGPELETMSAQQRHKVRIKVKKLRYAAGFFDSLFSAKRDRKRLKRLAKHLKGIQSALGALNDARAHQDMTTSSALHAPRRHRRARAFVAGVLLGREQESTKPLIKAARKDIAALSRVGAA
jgi:inorganic triphosphatase YgiF